MPLLLHQADMIAARVEWEQEWLSKVGVPKQREIKPSTPTQFKQQADMKKLQSLSKGNAGLLNALKGL